MRAAIVTVLFLFACALLLAWDIIYNEGTLSLFLSSYLVIVLVLAMCLGVVGIRLRLNA